MCLRRGGTIEGFGLPCYHDIGDPREGNVDREES